ncbi:MAG TPA: hypothetical protein VG711_04360 [Phycisphaerales bacterium]|nr:hypothetical protein [Phycisphaerales bacterium]
MLIRWMCSVLVAGGVLTAQGEPPASQPAEAPQVQAQNQQAAVDPKVDALLDQLEQSSKDLKAVTAQLAYEKEDSLLGTKELRTGSLIYKVNDNGTKSFAILFDSLITGGSKREHKKHYIFNDRWLVEVDHEKKQFIKREIVAPGETFDPLKLGEGPFPLPIGQQKADVLKRFDVQSVNVPGEGMLSKLANVDSLLLTPKADAAEAKDIKSVAVFYDRDTHLPVGIEMIEQNDDRKTVKLANVARNPDLSAEQVACLSVEEPDPKEWQIDIRPWAHGGQSSDD